MADPTAFGGLKPNPSLAGTSATKKDMLWLTVELEVLEWWLSVREKLVIPIPRNPRDSVLLHAEKELLEWWHYYRETI